MTFESWMSEMEEMEEIEEMGLEELFSLCTSPALFNPLPLSRQLSLRSRWDTLVSERRWQMIEDMQPWPSDRMLQDWDSVLTPGGAGREAGSLSRPRYEAARLLWLAGILPEKAWAVEALRGAPLKSPLLSLPGAVWSYKKPGRVELHTVGPLQEDWDRFPLLDTLGIQLKWLKDPHRGEHYCQIPSDRFPALQEAGVDVYFRTWSEGDPRNGAPNPPRLRGVIHVRQTNPDWTPARCLGGQHFDLFCYRFDMVSHFPICSLPPSLTLPEDEFL